MNNTNNESNARESFFYWNGDWKRNLFTTIKATFVLNYGEIKKYWAKKKKSAFGCVLGFLLVGIIFAILLSSVAFLPFLSIVLVGFMFLWCVLYNTVAFFVHATEFFLTKIRGETYLCPSCKREIVYPVYHCPVCNAAHGMLMPSAHYGIYYRECTCGQKIPTMQILGREQLGCTCDDPYCQSLPTGKYTPETIAFLGGPSVGKSMIHMMMIEKTKEYCVNKNWAYNVLSVNENEYEEINRCIASGQEPGYFRGTQCSTFFVDVQSPRTNIPERLNFCDLPWKTLDQENNAAELNYYKNLRVVVMVIDPFALPVIRKACRIQVELDQTQYHINAEPVSPEEVFDQWMSGMKQYHHHMKNGVICAVVINKVEVPGFYSNTRLSVNSSDADCRCFLGQCKLNNLMQKFQDSFLECRYFAVSATGGVVPGKNSFSPRGFEALVQWMLEQKQI